MLFQIHLTILAATIIVILCTEHLGFQYVRGLRKTLNLREILVLHYLVLAGLSGMILTGFTMAYPAIGTLLSQPLFILKVSFVVILIINAIFIASLIKIATEVPFVSLTLLQKAPLIVSGALSTVGWIGAIISALLLFGWPALF